jgi:hypothetical protein
LHQNLEGSVKSAMAAAGAKLAAATHAHIIEQANQKLHTRRQKFVDALTVFPLEQSNGQTWIVNLDRKARWIDDGLQEHEMIDDLLASPKAKTAKDGSKYLVIPFDHSPGKGGPTTSTPAQRTLIDSIRSELKARDIPFGKLERGPDGKPLLGNLHALDITRSPPKTAEGPGQGWGPVGAVRQGPTIGPGGEALQGQNGGTPFLQGIRVSQNQFKDPKTGATSVKRSIHTFRIASSKHKGSGRWVHPGLEAKHLLEEGATWASDQWTRVIGPEMLAAVVRGM